VSLPRDGVAIIVGLGNPGERYAGTRHNIGAMLMDLLAVQAGERWKAQRKTRCDVVETRWGRQRVVLAKPHSYMNESGGPVSALTQYYDVPPQAVVVAHDELDLPFGILRVKAGGGDNGHNGLKSIRQSLSSGETVRIRLGVGRPPGRQDPADFVLRPFSATERRDLEDFLLRAADATECVVTDGVAVAQNRYNANPQSDGEGDR
jgi:peptidyl-tRNA hydrolase, PTH1 family